MGGVRAHPCRPELQRPGLAQPISVYDLCHSGWLLASQLAIYATSAVLPGVEALEDVPYDFQLPAYKIRKGRKATRVPRRVRDISSLILPAMANLEENLDELDCQYL